MIRDVAVFAIYTVAAAGVLAGIGLVAAHVWAIVARRNLAQDLERLSEWRRRG